MNHTAGAAARASPICDLAPRPIVRKPFPHIVNKQFIASHHYEQLRASFPTCPPNSGPPGYSLFWGDDAYQQLLDEQPSWAALFNTVQSQQFIDWGVEQFGAVWQAEGCRIDPSKARYVRYREDRIDKELPAIRKAVHAPEELWVRMDIYQGRKGYSIPVHRDHPRRLISMLIYMCDHAENQMVGGELLLHYAVQPRWYHRSPVKIAPHHNQMVALPCSARSFHSVPEITSLAQPRNYLQIHISSSVDVWGRP